MLELLAVAAAGAAAGAANSVAGGGALITFPTMVALGLPPLAANVTNTVGIVPASIGGALGYRDLLREQGARFSRLLPPLLLGAVAGSAALLLTSDETFEAIVPILIAASCLLLLLQPRLVPHISHAGNERSPYLIAGIAFCGAYQAYFGSAVSILVLAILALFVADTIQHLNGMKILLAGCSNLLAAVIFAVLAPVDWRYAVTIMVSSFAGGRIGAHYARRIPADP
ncbi:MAG TPA: sulfite exporter TauE/SafE family protein, partial [Solirubrobacterales bacterium]